MTRATQSPIDPPWSRFDGELFQDLVVDLLNREGFYVEPSGVGPDGGIDAFAEQRIQFGYNSESFVWAVQCKFKSRDGASISPSAVGEILNVVADERFKSRQISGYFLVTNARLSTNMMSQLRGLNGRMPGFRTTYWDRSRLNDALARHYHVYSKYFSDWTDVQSGASTFLSACKDQPNGKKEQLRQRINLLASTDRYGAMLVSNIHSESRLSQEVWQELINLMLDTDLDAVELEYAAIRFFRSHPLCGKEVALPVGQIFGSMVPFKRLALSLNQQYAFATPSEAEAYLDYMLERKRVNPLTGPLCDAYIGHFSKWSTFSKESASSPFGSLPKTVAELRSQFGVDRDARFDRFVVLQYKLDPSNPPRTPTICDLYAGGIRQECRVPTPSEDFVYRWPADSSVPPLPEVVHKPVSFKQLVEASSIQE